MYMCMCVCRCMMTKMKTVKQTSLNRNEKSHFKVIPSRSASLSAWLFCGNPFTTPASTRPF